MQDATQLPQPEDPATIAKTLSLRDALDLVLADLPETPDPNLVAFVDVSKADAIRRRLAARIVLRHLADTLS